MTDIAKIVGPAEQPLVRAVTALFSGHHVNPAFVAAQQAAARTAGMIVSDQASLDQATAEVLVIVDGEREIARMAKPIKEEIGTAHKTILRLVDAALQKIVPERTRLDGQIADYHARRDGERQAAIQADVDARESAAEEDGPPLDSPAAITPVPRTTSAAGGTVTVRQSPEKARVVDAARVPREFLVVDLVAVMAHRRRHPDELIAGIEFYREPTVSHGRRR